MSLLSPWFLAGLVALAVPVWLHLVAREAPAGTPFPSLMFVKRMAVKVVRRRKLRDPWLLVLRCLGLFCLVLAFAQPLLPHRWLDRPGPPDDGAAGGGHGDAARHPILIAIDTSGSMRAQGRFEEAREAVQEILADLGEGQPVGLLQFAEHPRLLVSPGGKDSRGQITRALRTLEPGFGRTRYGPAMREAIRVLQETGETLGSGGPGNARGTVALVSDLQRTGLARLTAVAAAPGIDLRIITVGDTETVANASLVEVVARSARIGQPRGTASEFRGQATVRVRNTGAVVQSGLEANLSWGDEASARSRAGAELHADSDRAATASSAVKAVPPLAPGEEVRLSFDFDLERSRATRLFAHLSQSQATATDILAEDDRYHAVAQRRRPLSVVLARRSAAATPTPDRTQAYLRSAVSVAHGPRIELALLAQSDPNDVASWKPDLLVIDGPGTQAAARAAEIESFVRDGGTVLVLAGGEGGATAARDTAAGTPETGASWSPRLLPLLPARPGRLLDLRADPVTLVPAAVAHPLTLALGDALDGPLRRAEIFHLRNTQPGSDSTTLAFTSRGDPALLARTVGAGQVLLLTTSLDPAASTIGLSSGFAPWFITLVQYAANYRAPPAAVSVGTPIDLRTWTQSAAVSDIVLEGPDGEGERHSGSQTIVRPGQPGFYEVHTVGDPLAGRRHSRTDGAGTENSHGAVSSGRPVAVNFPSEEANLERMAPGELQTVFVSNRTTAGVAASGSETSVGLTAHAREASDAAQPWWFLLLAGLIVLLVESLLAASRRHASRMV